MESSNDSEHSPGIENVTSREASPERTRPINAPSLLRAQPKGPTLIPFSEPDANFPEQQRAVSQEPEEADTTIEGDPSMVNEQLASEGMPQIQQSKPVLRDRNENEDLRLRFFELQMELKRIRDKLKASAQTVPDAQPDLTLDDEAESAPLVAQLNNAQNENRELRTQLEDSRSLVASLRNESSTLRTDLSTASSEIANLKAEIKTMDTANDTSPLDLKPLRVELDVARGQLAASKSREKAMEEENKRLSAELERMKQSTLAKRRAAELSTSSEELEDLRTRLARAMKQKSQISAMLEEQFSLNDENAAQLDGARLHIDELESEISSLNEKLADKTSAADELRNNLTSAETTIKSLTEKLTESTEKTTSLTNDLHSLQRDIDAKSDALRVAKEHHKALEQRLSQQGHELTEMAKDKKSLGNTIERQGNELLRAKSELAEAAVQIKKAEEQYGRLSDTLESTLKENREYQKQIDKLRSELQARENDAESQWLENSRLNQLISELKSQVKALEAKAENLSTEKDRDIAKTQANVDRLLKQLEDQKTEYNTVVSELENKMAADLSHSRRNYEEEFNHLRAEKAKRERELISEATRLKASIIELKDEKATIEADRDALATSERQAQQRIKIFEVSLNDAKQSLTEAERHVRTAESEVREFKEKFHAKRIAEEALSDKVKTLEETVSKQAVQLSELNTGDVGALRSQAHEGANAIKELMNIQEILSNRTAEWMAKYSELTMHIQHLSDANAKMDEELSSYRNFESQREMQLQSTVYAAHKVEVDRLRADYQSSINILNESLRSTEEERDNFRKQVLEAKSSLQMIEFNASLAQQEVNQTRSIADRNSKDMADLQSRYNELVENYSGTKAQLNQLSSDMETCEASLRSKDSSLHSLRSQLDELQQTLHSEQDARSDIERQWYAREKVFNDYLEKLRTVLYAYSYQVESLIFIKIIFSKRYPRIDIIGVDGISLPTPKRRTLRDAAMFALAVVRFRAAAREGRKRLAHDNGQYLANNLPF